MYVKLQKILRPETVISHLYLDRESMYVSHMVHCGCRVC